MNSYHLFSFEYLKHHLFFYCLGMDISKWLPTTVHKGPSSRQVVDDDGMSKYLSFPCLSKAMCYKYAFAVSFWIN